MLRLGAIETPPERGKERFGRILGFVLGFAVGGVIIYIVIAVHSFSKFW